MDERRKTIRTLEEKKREIMHAIDLLLQDLGENLLARISRGKLLPKDSALSGGILAYSKYLEAIAAAEDEIKFILAEVERKNAMEAEIQKKSRENSLLLKELQMSYADVGELALQDDEFNDMVAPFKQQLEVFLPKIESLQNRLESLTKKTHENVFSWIGKNAHGIVIRSTLGKNQDAVRKIIMQIGEIVAKSDRTPNAMIVDFADTLDASREILKKSDSAFAEIDGLKHECEQIVARYAHEGSPSKKAQILRRAIANTQGDLKKLYLNFSLESEKKANRTFFADIFTKEDKDCLARVGANREDIVEYDSQIDKLKASLAIDAERVEIEKLERQIRDQRVKISTAEDNIQGFNRQIADSNKKIEELLKI